MQSFIFAALCAFVALAIPANALERVYPGGAALEKRKDAQSSRTLLAELVQTGSERTGQEDPTAGQVASATSKNNFINFCAQFPKVALTNGEQIQEGSCNGIPLGRIPPKNKTPSAMFQFPANNAVIPAGQDITFRIKTKNLQTGSFTNAQLTYYAAPVQLNKQNLVIGHSHITCQLLPSLNSVGLLDTEKFAFFKGLNDPADGNGELTTVAPGGLAAGAYRCCTINSSANHLPIVPAFAQRGNVDDCVRFTVTGNGGGGKKGNGKGKGGAKGGKRSNLPEKEGRRSLSTSARSRIVRRD